MNNIPHATQAVEDLDYLKNSLTGITVLLKLVLSDFRVCFALTINRWSISILHLLPQLSLYHTMEIIFVNSVTHLFLYLW